MPSFIKSILKNIFPILFLKKLHLRFNRLRILTLDRILFPELIVNQNDFLLYREGYPFRENKIEIDDLIDGEVRSYMKDWYSWTQEEFILTFKNPCIIEPDYGWAIVPPNRLLYYSLGISRTLFLPKPHFFKFLFRKNVELIKSAISLRDTGEENYFHFYNDVLTKIFFLIEHKIDVINIPVIISRKLWNKPYFQFYYEKSDVLKKLKWVIQDKQYIKSESVIFCKAITHEKKLLDQIFKPLYIPPDRSIRIFVTRNKKRLRHISNAGETENLFKKYGFEIIDADLLTIQQQIDYFTNASCIAGIHGAGLTNIMFRNGDCKVLEIFPPPQGGYLPFHYIMLAKMKGHKYCGIIGNLTNKYDTGFKIDIAKLEHRLKQIK